MCLYHQAPDEAAENVNLSQSVSIAAPEKTKETVPEKTVAKETVPEKTVAEETVPEETEEEKNLPEWSEKVASGILTGKVRLDPAPKIYCHFCCILFIYICKNKKNKIWFT